MDSRLSNFNKRYTKHVHPFSPSLSLSFSFSLSFLSLSLSLFSLSFLSLSLSLTYSLSLFIYIYIYIYILKPIKRHKHSLIYMYIDRYLYIYLQRAKFIISCTCVFTKTLLSHIQEYYMIMFVHRFHLHMGFVYCSEGLYKTSRTFWMC